MRAPFPANDRPRMGTQSPPTRATKSEAQPFSVQHSVAARALQSKPVTRRAGGLNALGELLSESRAPGVFRRRTCLWRQLAELFEGRKAERTAQYDRRPRSGFHFARPDCVPQTIQVSCGNNQTTLRRHRLFRPVESSTISPHLRRQFQRAVRVTRTMWYASKSLTASPSCPTLLLPASAQSDVAQLLFETRTANRRAQVA